LVAGDPGGSGDAIVSLIARMLQGAPQARHGTPRPLHCYAAGGPGERAPPQDRGQEKRL